MNEFDDDRLRDEFHRRAGGGVSITAAHDAVLARAGHIRRRRAAVAGTGALVALVVGGLVLLPRGGGDSLAPADSRLPLPTVEDVSDAAESTTATDDDTHDRGANPSSTAPSTSTPRLPAAAPSDRSTTTVLGGSATTSTPGASPTTLPSSSPAPTTSGGTATTTASSGPTATTTATSSSTASSSSSPSSSTSSVPGTTKPSVAPFTRTYDSAGGSITVDWDGDSFTLLSIAPAAGFSSEIEDQQATRIRVRFHGNSDDFRIEVRVDNGQLIVDIS